MSGRRVVKVADFRAEAERRFGADPRGWKVVCPMCGTIQSPADLLATGSFVPGSGQVNKFFGFSCIGRVTGQGEEGIEEKAAGRPWQKGCNWTLGGLFQMHTVELESEDGKRTPHFDLAEVGS